SIPDEFFLTKESTKTILLLPKRCPEGCTIVIYRYGLFNPKEMSVEEFQRMVMVMYMQLLRDPMTQINGFKFICDFKGTNLQILRTCTPHNLYLLYHKSLHCVPGRYKGLHFVNQSIVVKPCWGMLRPFLSEKLRNRAYFHSNVEELLNYFPPSVNPIISEIESINCISLGVSCLVTFVPVVMIIPKIFDVKRSVNNAEKERLFYAIRIKIKTDLS
ncbi:alpha-tocopherol transfer protein-like, partial [Trichonephila inaurata madagascariensis]